MDVWGDTVYLLTYLLCLFLLLVLATANVCVIGFHKNNARVCLR